VFFIATANDISKLPPEFVRAERFDAIYFIDIPGTAEKEKVWPLYLSKFGLSEQHEKRPQDRDWTGAEIRSCCRLSALLDVPLKEAARHVVPVAVTAADSMERLRSWASGRCLDATNGGIYNRGSEPDRPVRRVSRSSAN
jgi:SpoVK/Ycf46/Vps4 family AAA+-type ATPase